MNTAEQNYRLLQEIEANRRFMLMAYQQNPKLLERAEVRIKQMFEGESVRQIEEQTMTQMTKQRGISLIELIMFIVIVSVALAGILLVMNVTTKGSADPLIHKQAIAVAESLLEEIELQDFISASGVTAAVTQANRASAYHIVSDYNGFATTGIFSLADAASASAVLANYNASVAVASAVLGNITLASGSAVLITVTVTDPQTNTIQISGYRTAY